jgi:hypothetical protein
MFSHVFNRHFPIWEFLNQPVFDSQVKLILNPNEFWQQYRVELLERCWVLACQDSNKYPRA